MCQLSLLLLLSVAMLCSASTLRVKRDGSWVCDCDTRGSKDMNCDSANGQCSCKENVVGRNCNMCRPGFTNFPTCEPNLPRHFRLGIALRYDNLFLQNVAHGSHIKAMEMANRVVAGAQVYFREPISASLGTTIELAIKSIEHRDTQLRLRRNGTCNQHCTIQKAGYMTENDPDDADHYLYLSHDVLEPISTGDITGVSFLGMPCDHKNKYQSTSIIEKGREWEETAKRFAHTFGYALGMQHDSVNGCEDQDGIMDSNGNRDRWTTCSRQSLLNWYKQYGWKCRG